MKKNSVLLRAIRRFWNELLHLFSDIVYLKERNKLFIYSWMSYKGGKIVQNNWGDDINKFFLESVSSLKVNNIRRSLLYSFFPVRGYTCIGSLIGNFKAKDYEVWGTGIIEYNHKLLSKPQKVHSVRGPLTRDELLKNGVECPKIYGDPALLISRYYRKLIDKKYIWGVIPHYADEDKPALKEFSKRHPEVLIISMRHYDDWHEIPDKIMLCHKIMSSSLHGLIIADSYSVSNVWLRFSDEIKGGDFKYNDYFCSVGRDFGQPRVIESYKDLERIMTDETASRAYNIDYRSIFDACPFKEKLIDYNSLIPSLPCYASLEDKSMQFSQTKNITTEAELDALLKEAEKIEQNYMFRGIYNASYKMYASSQRHWMQKSDRMISLGTSNYYEAIKRLIQLTKDCPEVIHYQKKQSFTDNDMYILALMQHFGVPSPMIVFSKSIRKALFFAVDQMPKWEGHRTDSLDDYISIYYINKNVDWISGTVQKMNESAGDSVDCIVSDILEKEQGIKLNVENALNGFKHLNYSQFIPTGDLYDVKFIPVNGVENGTKNAIISVVNFSCSHMISNDRLLAQDGMFIFNNTTDQPLVELINNITNVKLFSCLNIHKRLVPYIWERYLNGFLSHDSIYCEDDEDEMLLQGVMKKL